MERKQQSIVSTSNVFDVLSIPVNLSIVFELFIKIQYKNRKVNLISYCHEPFSLKESD